MVTRVRAADGSIQTFPDSTPPESIRMGMLAYDNKEDWGPLSSQIVAALGQSTEAEDEPTKIEGVTVVAPRHKRSFGHPNAVESLIPVWGSGREAIADFQEGDYLGAGINAALAGSDLFLAKSIATGLAKGGLLALTGGFGKPATAAVWKNMRARMARKGMIKKGDHGHHWLIHQNGPIAKYFPNVIKNHPLNILPLPAKAIPRESGKGVSYVSEMHQRLHKPTKAGGYNPIQKYWYGTPSWFKAAKLDAAEHAADNLNRARKR